MVWRFCFYWGLDFIIHIAFFFYFIFALQLWSSLELFGLHFLLILFTFDIFVFVCDTFICLGVIEFYIRLLLSYLILYLLYFGCKWRHFVDYYHYILISPFYSISVVIYLYIRFLLMRLMRTLYLALSVNEVI